MRHARQKSGGQVLLMALVILAGALVIALLLFDFQNVLRGKIKVETAQQAAALAGANWQKEGLNLIGELNLVKAAETMIFAKDKLDGKTDAGDEEEYFDRMRGLTELQSRTAFIVPLLGVMAVQETAKQNGMANNDSTLRHYVRETLPFHEYRAMHRHGYMWHKPYSRLLADILANGCPMRVNSATAVMPAVYSNPVSAGSFMVLLSDPGLYDAAESGDYLYWQLRQLAKSTNHIPPDWLDGIRYIKPPFCQESELLTLGVSGATLAPQENPDAGSICYYTFDNSWYPAELPAEAYQAHSSRWRQGVWLRNSPKKSFDYEGAVCAVDNYMYMPRAFKLRVTDPEKKGKKHKDSLFQKNLTGSSTTGTVLGSSPETDSRNYGVVAKVLGSLAGRPPIDIDIILPVFSKVSLVPSAMPYNTGMLTAGDNSLQRFLQWLSCGNSIRRGTPPSGTERYRDILLKLEDPEYLKSIFNLDFKQQYGGVDHLDRRSLFDDGYKFSQENPSGAGWLQQAWLGTVLSRPYVTVTGRDGQTRTYPAEDNTITEVKTSESGSTVRTYYGNAGTGFRFFITRNGRILTNEDMETHNRYDGGQYDFAPGYNTGPPRL